MRKVGMVSALILMVVAAVLLTGCQKPPDTEMQGTQQSMDAAKAAEAEKYAQAELGTATATMEQAHTEMEAQKAKWMPNYDKAKELLATAKTQADQAKEAAIAGKEKAKNDASTAISDAQMMVDGAEAGLKTAPKGKGTKADLEAFQKDIEGYKQEIADAKQMLASEDYLGAIGKANAAKDGAKSVQEQIVSAGGKIPQMKPAEMAPAAEAAPDANGTTN